MHTIKPIHLMKRHGNHRIPPVEVDDYRALIAEVMSNPALLERNDRHLACETGLAIASVWAAKFKAAKLLNAGHTCYQTYQQQYQ